MQILEKQDGVDRKCGVFSLAGVRFCCARLAKAVCITGKCYVGPPRPVLPGPEEDPEHHTLWVRCVLATGMKEYLRAFFCPFCGAKVECRTTESAGGVDD